jgi:hypothetical protein
MRLAKIGTTHTQILSQAKTMPNTSGCLLKMQYCQSDLELGPTALERLRELGYQ